RLRCSFGAMSEPYPNPNDPHVRAHPTHHLAYRPHLAGLGVGIGLAGAFGAVFTLMIVPGASAVLALARRGLLIAEAVAFIGGTLLAVAVEGVHSFPRCPQ